VLDEAGKVVEQGFEFDLGAVFSFGALLFSELGSTGQYATAFLRTWVIRWFPLESTPWDHHFAGVIGVQGQVETP